MKTYEEHNTLENEMKTKDEKVTRLADDELDNVNGGDGMKIIIPYAGVKKYILDMLFKIKKGRK